MTNAKAVLVLGAVGFVGRHLITYIVENNLATEIRAVDKTLPQTAYLNERQQRAFERVEYQQRNLANPDNVRSVFTRTDGSSFDLVFNCAGETRYSQNENLYKDRIVTLAKLCGKEAAERGVKCFVELSTGEVYESNRSPSKEDHKLSPWTTIGKFRKESEIALQNIPNLNLVILRPAIIYGPGATSGLTPRLICGPIYKKLSETMTVLWSDSLKINTVHVQDVVRAMWHVTNWYQENNMAGKGPLIYNLADQNNTDQGCFNKHIEELFHIKTGFHNVAINAAAEHDLDAASEEVNERHMRPWTQLLTEAGIRVTPLSPYTDKELLLNNNLTMDGSKITQVTGFQYEVPKVTTAKLQEIIDEFKQLKLWPPLY